jgi:hypothetical protein
MDNTRLPTRPQLQTSRKKRSWDALGNDGNASMQEQVNRPNPWRKKKKMMMMMMMMMMMTR